MLQPDILATRDALNRVLRSPGFQRSERISAFLASIVESKLAGREAEIKESILAIKLFGRDGSFDSATDSIVRVEARRLRKKLAEYYQGPGQNDPLRIDVPKGSYAPEFLPVAEVRSRIRRKKILAAACVAAVIAIVGISLAAYRHSKRTQLAALLDEAAARAPLGQDYALMNSSQRYEPRNLDDLMAAASLYEKVLTLEPGNPRAHAGLARAYWLAGDYDPKMHMRAKAASERAISNGAGLPDFYFFKAYAEFFLEKDFERARADFRRAIQLNDRIDLYYRYYADTAWLSGRLTESEAVLRRGRSLLPESDTIALAWIVYLFRAERIEESIREAEDFARRRPNLHTAHRFRGVTLSLGGQFGPALSAFEHCLRLSPEDRPCLAGMARVHAKSGNIAEARAILAKLQSMGASPMFGAAARKVTRPGSSA